MSEIILSFCVPTYNRPERIYNLINQVISIQSDEIELVIGDDNPSSSRTEELVKSFDDLRIKYFHNLKNLGHDANILKIIKKAKGEYIFLIVDEDDIEVNNIPWILKELRENKNLTYLRGTLGDKRPNKNIPYYKFEDITMKRGASSLKNLLFYNMHGSGMILKRNVLNLNRAMKNVGSLIIQDILTIQALLAGDTLCSSKIFAYIGEKEYKSHLPLVKEKEWLHPLTALNVTKFRIEIIYEISNGDLRTYLLNKQEYNIFLYLCNIYSYEDFHIYNSIKSFLKGLFLIFMMKKISWSVRFWLKLGYRLLFKCRYL